jgi:hypothetical protein
MILAKKLDLDDGYGRGNVCKADPLFMPQCDDIKVYQKKSTKIRRFVSMRWWDSRMYDQVCHMCIKIRSWQAKSKEKDTLNLILKQ